MSQYAIITELTGNELFFNELSVGMLVKILGRYGNSIDTYACTALGVNSLNCHWEDGYFDTILTKWQLQEVGFGSGTGISGIILSDGSWIECGCGCHSYLVKFLEEEGYITEEDEDEVIFLSSGMGTGDQYISVMSVSDITLEQKRAMEKNFEKSLSPEQSAKWNRIKERKFVKV